MFLFLVGLSLSTVVLFAQDSNQKDEKLIKKVINDAYVEGLCNKFDKEAIEAGIHPLFSLYSIGMGNRLYIYPISNWLEDAKEGEKKGFKYSFQNEITTIKYLFLDITGKTAVAKIEFYEGGELHFIDYLSLIKFEDGWKLVSKMAHRVTTDNNSH